MITPEYCLLMARYNRWQNAELTKSLEVLSDAELRAERGAFFGSIFKTVNHLLWGDTLWISRFDGGEGPAEQPYVDQQQSGSAGYAKHSEYRTDIAEDDASLQRLRVGAIQPLIHTHNSMVPAGVKLVAQLELSSFGEVCRRLRR